MKWEIKRNNKKSNKSTAISTGNSTIWNKRKRKGKLEQNQPREKIEVE